LRRFGKKRSLSNGGNIQTFAKRGWGKPRKNTVRIAIDPADIWTEHLHNTGL
jgi:hypothetical protein